MAVPEQCDGEQGAGTLEVPGVTPPEATTDSPSPDEYALLCKLSGYSAEELAAVKNLPLYDFAVIICKAAMLNLLKRCRDETCDFQAIVRVFGYMAKVSGLGFRTPMPPKPRALRRPKTPPPLQLDRRSQPDIPEATFEEMASDMGSDNAASRSH